MPKVSVLVATIALGAIGLVSCGGSDAAEKSAPEPAHQGMTAQEMKCMAEKYAEDNTKACATKGDTSGDHGGDHGDAPAALANPLALTPDGLIDADKVDLSGVAGVSKEDREAAEKLLVSTIKILPRWSDPNQAVADGFQSIGDAATGEEHFLHWDWIEDDVIFDPKLPESLVYKVDNATGTKTLEAAMFILPSKYTLDNTPAIRSKLVQFHLHNNLCFTAPPAPQVRGLTTAEGGCNPPLVKFNPNIQAHVWIRANECGPFASLLGVGAGQIKPGEERSCIMDHTKVGL